VSQSERGQFSRLPPRIEGEQLIARLTDIGHNMLWLVR